MVMIIILATRLPNAKSFGLKWLCLAGLHVLLQDNSLKKMCFFHKLSRCFFGVIVGWLNKNCRLIHEVSQEVFLPQVLTKKKKTSQVPQLHEHTE